MKRSTTTTTTEDDAPQLKQSLSSLPDRRQLSSVQSSSSANTSITKTPKEKMALILAPVEDIPKTAIHVVQPSQVQQQSSTTSTSTTKVKRNKAQHRMKMSPSLPKQMTLEGENALGSSSGSTESNMVAVQNEDGTFSILDTTAAVEEEEEEEDIPPKVIPTGPGDPPPSKPKPIVEVEVEDTDEGEDATNEDATATTQEEESTTADTTDTKHSSSSYSKYGSYVKATEEKLHINPSDWEHVSTEAGDQMVIVSTVASMALIVGALSARRLRSRQILGYCFENEEMDGDHMVYDRNATSVYDGGGYDTFTNAGVPWRGDLEKFDV
eukprot:CAMPEP_0195507698 /NCGR_PEP_ID=MMETSP0794_2-20130614/1093_1 /TAXON_ID=515487 /ORGANISM="Stephanopyxis turris, Strain CCMP 815" /LENGTH=324 /DNA_ID=CAMNT_0040634461 /DNA_START=262 /DNA_END=1236 /DNA_ORIENTATION=+